MDDLTQQISQRLDLSFGLVRSVIQVKERLNTIESPEGSQEIGIYSGIDGMHPEGLSQTMGYPYHSDSGHDLLITCYPIFREIHVHHSGEVAVVSMGYPSCPCNLVVQSCIHRTAEV